MTNNITLPRATVQQALEALENSSPDQYPEDAGVFYDAKNALRTALEQQAEPVAWDKPSASFNAWWDSYRHDPANPFAEGSAAYWAWAGWKSPQRQWVGLTDEEIHRTTVLLGFNPEWKTEIGITHAIVRNLEAKLKERNNG